MSKKVTVLFHDDMDGFAAALAIWLIYRDKATYIPVQYGEPVPEIPEGTTDLFIVDFCYDRKKMAKMCDDFGTVTVYDHHASSSQAMHSWENLPGNLNCHFNIKKSGCAITWEEMHPGKEMPDILKYVQDYDLWKFELPDSEGINMYISLLPPSFGFWRQMTNIDFVKVAATHGKVLVAHQNKQVAGTLENVRMMRFTAGDEVYEVPVVNCSANISEVGQAMCAFYPRSPFSVSYYDRRDLRAWSLRSDGKFDVSEVAKVFGGGGHAASAGFETEIGWPQVENDEFVKEFENLTGKDEEDETGS